MCVACSSVKIVVCPTIIIVSRLVIIIDMHCASINNNNDKSNNNNSNDFVSEDHVNFTNCNNYNFLSLPRLSGKVRLTKL